MFCQFGGPTSAASISLGTSPLAVGEDFRYLGSLLQSDGSIDRDVTRRMNAGWMKWKQLTGTTCDRKMPIKIKGKIYKSVIRPVMLYGAECWATKVCDEKRMHVTEMRMLRWMCGVTRKDRIRNEYIRGSMKVAPIVEKMKSHRLSWFGHVMRREDDYVTKKVLEMRPEGRRKRGRPRKTWLDCVKENMRECGVNEDMTEDRVKWRDMTNKADPK
ncbi:hypothetical protein JYU34_003595 [Plutella xylostella]|uniref:Endonuclease-reverse transcriptase n=1 Tax=Plutella xylostella TaxID=51655 RepID=A0ABQ7R0F7_PLUXY|nr:hypothetical protein JYU34_003595 [Plutella xylostella]